MSSARKKKEHKTLSDLLADDVRDYFLREGTNPLTSPEKPTRRSRSAGNNNKNGKKNRPKPMAAPSMSSVSSSASSSMGGSLRAGWVAKSGGGGSGGKTPSSRASSSSSISNRSGNSMQMETVGEKDEPRGEREYQQKQRQDDEEEQQFRGQHTAERHGANDNDNNNFTQNMKLHQRHNSSSSILSKSSLSAHRRIGSGGSLNSKSSRDPITAADAEFLRRYAEEKERTNNRMPMLARPNRGAHINAAAEMKSPDESIVVGGASVGSASPTSPYHALLTSPRPPTVAGSHRPGLPSIDGDDWEEDDRLERRDRRKMERKEARRSERHKRRASSMGGDSLADRSVVLLSSHREDGPRTIDRMEHTTLLTGLSRYTSPGSVASAGGIGLTPGSEQYRSESSTLCYSTASSHAFPPPDMPFQKHARDSSMGTFVRKSSSGSNNANSAAKLQGRAEAGVNGGRRQERYPQQETLGGTGSHNGNHTSRDAEPTKSPKNRHVRPLSYLSASSDSGKDSGERMPQGLNSSTAYNYSNEKGDNNSSPSSFEYNRFRSQSASTNFINSSPHSSSLSGTYQNYGNNHEFVRHISSETSDLQTSLLGSELIDLATSGESRTQSGESSSRFTQTNSTRSGSGYGAAAMGYSQRRRYTDDESSDGSYGSESSDESSYTSDSYCGDSSSTSLGRYGQNNDSNGVTYQPVKFSNYALQNGHLGYRDVEAGGRNESDRLLGGNSRGQNYSSAEMSHPNRKLKNRRTSHRSSTSTANGRRRNVNRLGGPGSVPLRLDDAIEVLGEKCNAMFVVMELFISNMPSLVGSLALAFVSLGVDWFKWYEETFNACHPTEYHNAACIFTEFPGCFACETQRDGYQFFLRFHYLCSTIAFILSSFLVGKILIAFPVVRDELANPTTAAPLGLLCMAFEKVFAGNFGLAGMGVTYVASALHTAVAVWFIFISVVYKTLPEPSWFSNTTGIGLAAAKIYLYWTGGGYFLAAFSVLLFSLFYCVALYRIHLNDKISASVCWVQLSGPAVVLYGFTIFSQPGSYEDAQALLVPENHEHFYQVHRKFFMPIMHTLFGFCMVSMVSSLYLLSTRWKSFREKEFSPAHVSFCAPLISHANAMQAYRSSLNKFSRTPSVTVFKTLLYRYWTLSLICGTVLLFVMSWKFMVYVPSWCQIDVEDDEMPPAPDETIVTRLLQKGEAGDSMKQNFFSAAVLQANESGALVRVLQDGKMKYVRSRRMPSMGFDPVMRVSELVSERDRLLQHVSYAADPSRDREGMSSFDDVLRDTFQEPERLRPSMGRKKLNFMSFDASTMMRPSGGRP